MDRKWIVGLIASILLTVGGWGVTACRAYADKQEDRLRAVEMKLEGLSNSTGEMFKTDRRDIEEVKRRMEAR